MIQRVKGYTQRYPFTKTMFLAAVILNGSYIVAGDWDYQVLMWSLFHIAVLSAVIHAAISMQNDAE